jgi:alpha-D-xyloside xylohydrolase
LHLSDKSDPNNNGEPWWKSMITEHRDAGYAFDHQVNDNAWRASNEATSGQKNSWFEFRADRFPDPAEYKRWCDENGVTVTLDLNRPGIPLNPSWDNAYSIPGTNDCPDFTNPAAVDWIWDLFFSNALDPALGYPGDAIWLDEFDYPDHAHSTTLFSGKRWAEESINYHLNLLKACVQEGWDPAFGEAKRPYFWSRGITAGAQRWGTHWTGDIDGNWTDMAYQVKAMQSSGISGFPYFNHDAGAHFAPEVNEDNLYRQWDMAFGSFTPIWKPHGPGHKRWPLQRNSACQDTARTYITNRYQMIPYIYSYAHAAQQTGIPMARPMFLEDQDNPTAWERDMQYLWGWEMLVAPNCSDGGNSVSVWLPSGNWYYFWDDTKYAGNTTENISAATGVLPVFVREGAIIPTAPFASSTFFIPQDILLIHAYTGADGAPFRLYEDDGVTERFRTAGELRTTDLRFTQQDLVVEIGAAQGTYANAPTSRSYQVIYHGLSDAPEMYVNGTPIESYASEDAIPQDADGAVWDGGLLTVHVASRPVDGVLVISSSATPTTGTGGAGGTAGSGGTAGAGGTANSGGTLSGGTAGSGGVSTSGGTTASGGGTAATGATATDSGGTTGAGGTATSGGGTAATGATATDSGGTTGAGGTSSGASTSTGTGGAGEACSAGLTLCGGLCVDLMADAANCGQCDMVCASDQVCSVGACTGACPDGLSQCGQGCVDLGTHILNCGECGNACQAGQTCAAGQCTGTATGADVSVPVSVDPAAADDATAGATGTSTTSTTSGSGCGCVTPPSRPTRLDAVLSMLFGAVLLGRRRRHPGRMPARG